MRRLLTPNVMIPVGSLAYLAFVVWVWNGGLGEDIAAGLKMFFGVGKRLC